MTTPIEGVGAQWGSFQPQQQAAPTVPSANTEANGPINQLLSQLGQGVNPSDIKAALAPIAGAHTVQMPSNFQTPVQPFQPTPMDRTPAVGAGYARAQGIGNAITGAMNVLGSVVTAEKQNKQNVLRDAATKVITSQSNMDEAQQQLEMARKSGDTETALKMQQIIEQNKKVMGTVFADKKLRNDLAKGFNFNYVDPSKNKTEYHAAVSEAIKNAKTHQQKIEAVKALKEKMNTGAASNAQNAFMASQPQGLAPNTQAQTQLQMKMEQQKNIGESIKALAPVWSAQIKAGSDLDRAKMQAQVQLRVAAVNGQKDIDKQLLVNKQHSIDNQAARSLAAYKAHLDTWIHSVDSANPEIIMKDFQTAADSYQKNLSAIQQRRDDINKELDKVSASYGSNAASRTIELRRELESLDQQRAAATTSLNSATQYAAKMTGMNVDSFKLNVPTVHVGDGVNSDAAKSNSFPKPATHSDSADIDPRTGRPFSSRVSTAERILIKAHHQLGEAGVGASRVLGNVNREASKIKNFFGAGSQSN